MKARVKRKSMKEEVVASESDLPTLAQSVEMREMMQERAKVPQANPQLSAMSGQNPQMAAKFKLHEKTGWMGE